jgi:hypothetical protein
MISDGPESQNTQDLIVVCEPGVGYEGADDPHARPQDDESQNDRPRHGLDI